MSMRTVRQDHLSGLSEACLSQILGVDSIMNSIVLQSCSRQLRDIIDWMGVGDICLQLSLEIHQREALLWNPLTQLDQYLSTALGGLLTAQTPHRCSFSQGQQSGINQHGHTTLKTSSSSCIMAVWSEDHTSQPLVTIFVKVSGWGDGIKANRSYL